MLFYKKISNLGNFSQAAIECWLPTNSVELSILAWPAFPVNLQQEKLARMATKSGA